MEEEFKDEQERAPVPLHLDMGLSASSKTWDQQRKKKNVTHRTVVCFKNASFLIEYASIVSFRTIVSLPMRF